MTRILSALLLLFLAGASMGQSVPKSDDQPASLPPAITAAFDGPRSTVFESPKEACNDNDIPDSMARAFRDFTGTVHLVAASSEMFQNLGPTLEDVHHICGVAFDSVRDPNPAQYNDQIWLSSFYTLDGVTVAALSHIRYVSPFERRRLSL